MPPPPEFSIAIIGDRLAGKSSLLQVIGGKGPVTGVYSRTECAEKVSVQTPAERGGLELRVDFIEIPYETAVLGSLRKTNGVILVGDVEALLTKRKGLEADAAGDFASSLDRYVSQWVNYVRRYPSGVVPIFLCLTKSDKISADATDAVSSLLGEINTAVDACVKKHSLGGGEVVSLVGDHHVAAKQVVLESWMTEVSALSDKRVEQQYDDARVAVPTLSVFE